MALLRILTAPDPKLKMKAERVAAVDASIRQLMDDMLETMYAAPGIGLAAPQIGVSKPVIVFQTGKGQDHRHPVRMAYPDSVWASGSDNTSEEGSMAVP